MVVSGGVLGLGAHRQLVPVEAVARVSDHVRLHLPEEAVPRARTPTSAWSAATTQPSTAATAGTPFWDATYTSPYFHDWRR